MLSEAPTLVPGLDDLAVVREPFERGRRHLPVAEHRWPFGEQQVGCDDRGRVLAGRLSRWNSS